MIYINPTFSRGGWTVLESGHDGGTLETLSELAARATEDLVQTKQRNAVWAWGDVPETLRVKSSQPNTNVTYDRLDHVFLDYDHLTDEDVDTLTADTSVPGLRVSSFSDRKDGVRKLHLLVPLANPVSVPRGQAHVDRSAYAAAVREVNAAVSRVLGRPLEFSKGGDADAASLEVTRLCFFSGSWDRELAVNEISPGQFPNTPQQKKRPGPRHQATSPVTQTRDFREGETPEAWLTRKVPTLDKLAGVLEKAAGRPVLFQDPSDAGFEWRYYHIDGSASTKGGVRAAYEQGSIMTLHGEATAPEGTVALHSTSLDWRTGFISTAELWMALANYYTDGPIGVESGTLTASGPTEAMWRDFLTQLGQWDKYEGERATLFEVAASADASEEDLSRAVDAVRSQLKRNKNGEAVPCLSNQELILTKDPVCGHLRRHAYTGVAYMTPEGMARLGVPPHESHMYERLFVPRLWAHVARTYGEGVLPFEERKILSVIDTVEAVPRSTPVMDYLSSLTPSDGRVVEDSIPWAETPAACDRVVRFLIAAYHQAVHPGKAYEPILVLDDPLGGVGKTSFLTQLFGQANWRKWEPGKMLGDSVQRTLGDSWLVLDDDSSSLATSAAASETKAFQSAPGGTFRILYSNAMASVPYHTVTAITSNTFTPPEDPALRRRLLVVPCTGTREAGIRLYQEVYTRPGWRDAVWSEIKYRYEVLGQRPEQPSQVDYTETERFVARTPVQEALEDLANDLRGGSLPLQNGIPMDVEVLRPAGKWEGTSFIRVRGANQYLRQVGILTNEGNSTHLASELLRCGFVRGPKSLRVDGRLYSGVFYPSPEGEGTDEH